jgi:hypothetical protein
MHAYLFWEILENNFESLKNAGSFPFLWIFNEILLRTWLEKLCTYWPNITFGKQSQCGYQLKWLKPIVSASTPTDFFLQNIFTEQVLNIAKGSIWRALIDFGVCSGGEIALHAPHILR